ncbi:MAG TPA: hypothetical protein VMU51_15510 [Mycobacteriales bacterium]|nr:hypothetical protein [Mycobacteriales bacterium]
MLAALNLVLQLVLLALCLVAVATCRRLAAEVRRLAAPAPDSGVPESRPVVRRHCGYGNVHAAHGTTAGLGTVWFQCPGGPTPAGVGRHARPDQELPGGSS